VYGAGSERLRAVDGPWYLGDALGSVRTTLDDAGAVVATASYDPWGVPQDGLVGPFGFTGELHHGDQVYLRARWYAPGSGTFTTRDPFAGFPEMPYSLHAYQYAYSAPTMWTDPTGEVIPRCPIGYHPMMRADGSFGGCARTGQVPPWVSDVSLGLPIPGTAGHLGGRTLGHLGREGLETCINLIGGTLVWMLTQTHVDTQTRRDDNRDKLIYYHYGTASKVAFIVTTETIPFSDASANPKRARYGSGVYFTDIAPGSISKAQIARALYGNPFPSTQKSVEAWVAVDLKGLQVTNPRNHVYLVQTTADFPISGRLINSGATP
jgi:RHS repeat-associated protein